MDNYGTHKAPKVRRWFVRHPRYHLHVTPTSASWLNQVERFFATITTRRIPRGTFESVRDLETAIESDLTHHNAHGKPFVWTATADVILDKSNVFANELQRHDTRLRDGSRPARSRRRTCPFSWCSSVGFRPTGRTPSN